MTCPFRSFSPPIIWFGPVEGKLRTYSDGVNINHNLLNYDRIRITGDHENGEYNLKILKLTLEDAGQYKCHSSENGSVLQAVYLLNILGNNSFFCTKCLLFLEVPLLTLLCHSPLKQIVDPCIYYSKHNVIF